MPLQVLLVRFGESEFLRERGDAVPKLFKQSDTLGQAQTVEAERLD